MYQLHKHDIVERSLRNSDFRLQLPQSLSRLYEERTEDTKRPGFLKLREMDLDSDDDLWTLNLLNRKASTPDSDRQERYKQKIKQWIHEHNHDSIISIENKAYPMLCIC